MVIPLLKSTNQKLAFLALALALPAMIISSIAPEGYDGVNEKPHYISQLGLAQKIKNREQLLLVDLRPKVMYDSFHLPSAENILPDQILTNIQNLPKHIVFYSGDDELTRELWSILPDSLKQNSTILFGGVHDWYEKILYPKISLQSTDTTLMGTIKDVCRFYGGKPEYMEGPHSLHYYHQDLTKVLWPIFHRTHGLVRKGC